jgi:hypothetical protein
MWEDYCGVYWADYGGVSGCGGPGGYDDYEFQGLLGDEVSIWC